MKDGETALTLSMCANSFYEAGIGAMFRHRLVAVQFAA